MGGEGLFEGERGGKAGQGDVSAAGLGFPTIEVGLIRGLVGGELGSVEALEAGGFGFAVAQFDGSEPRGAGFLGGGGGEDEGESGVSGEGVEEGGGVSWPEEVAEEDAHGTAAPRDGEEGGWEGGSLGLKGEGGKAWGLEGVGLGGVVGLPEADGAGGEGGGGRGPEEEETGEGFFRWSEGHGSGEVAGNVDARGDLFAEHLHGGGVGPGEDVPVEVPQIIARLVGAMVFELEGVAGAEAGVVAPEAGPAFLAQGKGPALGGGLGLGERRESPIHEVEGGGRGDGDSLRGSQTWDARSQRRAGPRQRPAYPRRLATKGRSQAKGGAPEGTELLNSVSAIIQSRANPKGGKRKSSDSGALLPELSHGAPGLPRDTSAARRSTPNRRVKSRIRRGSLSRGKRALQRKIPA
jgi:hypothetical protein